MTRPFAWESSLSRAVNDRVTTAYSWGTHDCALAACDLALAASGIDPGQWFRGRYTTPQGALRSLRKFLSEVSPGDAEKLARESSPARTARLLELVAERIGTVFGWPSHPNINYAQRGDVVFVTHEVLVPLFSDEVVEIYSKLAPIGGCLGVVLGDKFVLAATVGWRYFPMSLAARAWKVG